MINTSTILLSSQLMTKGLSYLWDFLRGRADAVTWPGTFVNVCLPAIRVNSAANREATGSLFVVLPYWQYLKDATTRKGFGCALSNPE